MVPTAVLRNATPSNYNDQRILLWGETLEKPSISWGPKDFTVTREHGAELLSLRRQPHRSRLRIVRHCHGGIGFGSAHSPRLAPLASRSSCASVSSSGVYRRYHQANPALTSSWFKLRPSGRSTTPTVRPYRSRSTPCTVTVLAKTRFDVNCLARFAERLPFLRAVNAVQTDALALAVVHHRDGVAVGHAHHTAGEVGGEGLTGYESDAKEQR